MPSRGRSDFFFKICYLLSCIYSLWHPAILYLQFTKLHSPLSRIYSLVAQVLKKKKFGTALKSYRTLLMDYPKCFAFQNNGFIAPHKTLRIKLTLTSFPWNEGHGDKEDPTSSMEYRHCLRATKPVRTKCFRFFFLLQNGQFSI